ncbi:MAG: anaerobic ribonucleoside-triphosphate reductase activating protein [Flavobacteriaceae bacterium]|nr:anaerobic ribonucleoside-triphosphate reductase activating protein [Flavobacteriaceae bacterium]
MNYSDMKIVLQEIPGEITICFTITGCKINCKGCHSPFLWKKENGRKLSQETYLNILNRYKGFAGSILFMGGEWHKKELIKYLRIAKNLGYKTCLYTGLNDVHRDILPELTWLKTGPWLEEQGGLDSKTTNQKFIDVKTKQTLNHLFIKN